MVLISTPDEQKMAEAEAQAQAEEDRLEEQTAAEAEAEAEEEEDINASVRRGRLSYQLALLEDAMADIEEYHEDQLQNSETIETYAYGWLGGG